ncbi:MULTISPECIES: HigA family addiction module antitoxin [Providencia]|uniref:HigA family addiction module antitoxin n=1 Tax=Morganellaceae TaxID=1903414 RepID=UPI0018C4FC25|nr:HigA family addiction module antitoxin [Providencia rettgeri]EEU9561215.1 HigA family addiction module antidote protein [Escherichia coli]EGQ8195899.1 HigA family addiction module antidote protein [Vibrio parahaemolyticus]MBG6004729.1 HigA family addiction module antidote protein [Proteus mirabilis]EJD6477845.1 HigA family addiction module antidote protein [Providencia rettgeri]MBG6029372.1 HigA family addiction module antidote protein [Proteus mirabilis]
MQATRKPASVGDVLLYEYLIPAGMKINELSELLGVHRNTVSALVNNNRKLSMDMAFKLAKAFDTSKEYWINLQQAVDVWEVKSDPRIQEEISRIKYYEDFLEERSRKAA